MMWGVDPVSFLLGFILGGLAVAALTEVGVRRLARRLSRG